VGLTETQHPTEPTNSDDSPVPRTPAPLTESFVVRTLARVRGRIGSTLLRSLIGVLLGSLILRLASQAMGWMVQFYFAEIDKSHYRLTGKVAGLVIASFFITELLGSPVLGALSDRYGRRRFIILGPLLGIVAVQIPSMTTAIWLLVVTRLLEGLSAASSIPATLGYISEATRGRPYLRARVIGLFEITLVGGLAGGAVVGGYLWNYLGKTPRWIAGIHLISPAFSLNGLLYLASLAVFAWGLKDMRDRGGANPDIVTEGKLQHYKAVLRSPKVWRFAPAWLSVFAIFGVWINNSPKLLTGKDHFPDQLLTGNVTTTHLGNWFAGLAIIFAAGVLSWSFYLGRHRRTTVMLIATAGLMLTLLTVYGINHLGSRSHPLHYPLLGALFVGLLVLSGFTPAALTYLADITESFTRDRGSIMGLYSVFLGVGQAVGTSIGGFFADWNGVDGLLLLSAVFASIVLITLIGLRAHEASDLSVQSRAAASQQPAAGG
jgi:MFS family permease